MYWFIQKYKSGLFKEATCSTKTADKTVWTKREETSLNLGRKSRADEQERGQLKKKQAVFSRTCKQLSISSPAFLRIKKRKTKVGEWVVLIRFWALLLMTVWKPQSRFRLHSCNLVWSQTFSTKTNRSEVTVESTCVFIAPHNPQEFQLETSRQQACQS